MEDYDNFLKNEIDFEMEDDYRGLEDESQAFLYFAIFFIAKYKDISMLKKTKEYRELFSGLLTDFQKKIEKQLSILGMGSWRSEYVQKQVSGDTVLQDLQECKSRLKKNMISEVILADSLQKDNELSTKASIKKHISGRVLKIKKSYARWEKTKMAGIRERVYDKLDLSGRIKGWLSIAVLDSGTTPLCASLQNKFYPKTDYKSRLEVPYPIPRHWGCRSKLIGIKNEGEIEKYKVEDFSSFLQRNSDFGKKYIGIAKYDLFKKNDLEIKDLIDFKKQSFLTNKEIVKKYGEGG